MLENILRSFGVEAGNASITPINTGHINKTFKVEAGKDAFILQRINNKVFTRPEIIASNLEYCRQHLSKNHPEYLFISPIKGLVYDDEKNPWRLYPYISNTYTIDEAQTVDQAFEAAESFGKFGKVMNGCDISLFKPTIERFHDLELRYQQFLEALANAKASAPKEVEAAIKFKPIVDRYNSVIASKTLKPGIFHNDTKINNVLFDRTSKKALAVIDLDTVMQGYFIYDLGDLIRTLVSPVSEEERDLDKVIVRKEFYEAVMEGYQITDEEKPLASFAGEMMTYIMAIRFLADYLRGNTYYHITYPDQNLVRARNQLRLTELLREI